MDEAGPSRGESDECNGRSKTGAVPKKLPHNTRKTVEPATVETTLGFIRGKVGTDLDGKPYHAFLGVPYARPPVGELRFSAPEPAEAWEGVRDATEEGDECYSHHLIEDHVVGSEDCLHLNVYTPLIVEGSGHRLLPVMVYIHGGSFLKGSNKSELHGPNYLVGDVVLVTVNYRLGIFGFLNLCEPQNRVPGNAGIKDVVMALKWVQDNIIKFGGDPYNVTAFGIEAGAAIIHYIILSKWGAGLFHKAILQSGTALNGWARGQYQSFRIKQYLNIQVYDDHLLDILRHLSLKELLKIQDGLKERTDGLTPRLFAPVVERASESAIITVEPWDVIESGDYNKIPIVFGYAKKEGLIYDVHYMKYGDQRYPYPDFRRCIPFQLGLGDAVDLIEQVATRIQAFYAGHIENTWPSKEKDLHLMSDLITVRGVYSSLRLHALTNTSRVYLYRFSMESKCNWYKLAVGVFKSGTCHGDEIGYLFSSNFGEKIQKNSLEELLVKKMVGLWTSIAQETEHKNGILINGNQAIWVPVRLEEIRVAEIDNFGVKHTDFAESGRMEFWDSIIRMNPKICYRY